MLTELTGQQPFDYEREPLSQTISPTVQFRGSRWVGIDIYNLAPVHKLYEWKYSVLIYDPGSLIFGCPTIWLMTDPTSQCTKLRQRCRPPWLHRHFQRRMLLQQGLRPTFSICNLVVTYFWDCRSASYFGVSGSFSASLSLNSSQAAAKSSTEESKKLTIAYNVSFPGTWSKYFSNWGYGH